MAVRRLSNGGGIWSVGSTWDGGVAPTSADDVRADSLSGDVTINANASIRSVDFAGYIKKLTINSGVQLSLTTAGVTSTFSTAFTSNGGYDFQGTGTSQGAIVRSANVPIHWAGYPNRTSPLGPSGSIPYFINSNTSAFTSASDCFFRNIRMTSEFVINGTYSTYVSGNLLASQADIRFGGTQPWIISASAGVTQSIRGNLATTTNTGPATMIINTDGAILIPDNGNALILGNTRANTDTVITFTHIKGTVSNPTLLLRPNSTAGVIVNPIILSLTSSTKWDCFVDLSNVVTVGRRHNIWFNNGCSFGDFSVFSANNTSNTSGGTAYTLRFNTLSPSTTVSIDNLICNPIYQQGLATLWLTKLTYDYLISPTMSITINNSIDINGGSSKPSATLPTIYIESSEPGTTASLTVNTYNQYISRVGFTDIDCSSGYTLYGQGLTLSNTTNITQYTLPPASGGGGESSYTFVN